MPVHIVKLLSLKFVNKGGEAATLTASVTYLTLHVLSGLNIKSLRTGNGTEYCNEYASDYLKNIGINHKNNDAIFVVSKWSSIKRVLSS